MEWLNGTDGGSDMKAYRSIYSIVDHAHEKGLVLYGAGVLGGITLQIFSLFQIKPACFVTMILKNRGVISNAMAYLCQLSLWRKLPGGFPEPFILPQLLLAEETAPGIK